MSVFAEKHRAGDLLLVAILNQCLCDGGNVRIGKRSVGRCATMTAGPETDELCGIRKIGPLVIIVRDQPIRVD